MASAGGFLYESDSDAVLAIVDWNMLDSDEVSANVSEAVEKVFQMKKNISRVLRNTSFHIKTKAVWSHLSWLG